MKTLETIAETLQDVLSVTQLTPESLRGQSVPNGFNAMAVAICLANEIDKLKKRFELIENRIQALENSQQ